MFLLPRSNFTKEELKALKELRLDESQVILTTNKGVAIAVLDKADHINKVETMLEEGET